MRLKLRSSNHPNWPSHNTVIVKLYATCIYLFVFESISIFISTINYFLKKHYWMYLNLQPWISWHHGQSMAWTGQYPNRHATQILRNKVFEWYSGCFFGAIFLVLFWCSKNKSSFLSLSALVVKVHHHDFAQKTRFTLRQFM